MLQGFSSAQWLSPIGDTYQVARAEALSVVPKMALFPLMCACLHPSTSILTPGWSNSGSRESGMVWGMGSTGQSLKTRLLLICCLSKYQWWLPLPYSDTSTGLSFLCLSQLSSPLSLCCPCPGVELHTRAGTASAGTCHRLWCRLWWFGYRQRSRLLPV